MNITETISLLDELRGKVSFKKLTVYQCPFASEDQFVYDEKKACGFNEKSLDCSYDECHHPIKACDAEFVALLVNSYDSLRRAAVAGLELSNAVKKMSGDSMYSLPSGEEYIGEHAWRERRDIAVRQYNKECC